jgi:hypothetical protein
MQQANKVSKVRDTNIDCAECEGTGQAEAIEMYWSYACDGPGERVHTVDCERCSGSGSVEGCECSDPAIWKSDEVFEMYVCECGCPIEKTADSWQPS